MRHSLSTTILAGFRPACFIAAAMLSVAVLHGQTPDAEEGKTPPEEEKAEIKNAAFQEGLKSLKNNLPAIAVNHFSKALKDGPEKGKDWPPDQKIIIQQLLAESLVRNGKSAEALDLYSRLPAAVENNYWASIALIQQGAFTRALHWLSRIPDGDETWDMPANEARAYIADSLNNQRMLQASLEKLIHSGDPVTAKRSRIWLANCLYHQGKINEAYNTISPLIAPSSEPSGSELPKNTQSARNTLQAFAELTEARILTRQGKLNDARLIAARLSDNKNLSRKVRDLSQVALAVNELENEKTGAATTAPPAGTQSGEDMLLSFISSRPDSTMLADAFNALLREKTFEKNPQALEQLVSWASQSDSTRQPWAAYSLAETLFNKKEHSQALEIAKSNVKKNSDHPAMRQLIINTIDRLVVSGKYDEAEQLINSFPSKNGEIHFNEGVIAFRKKDYPLAAKYFDAAIKSGGASIAQEAYYNANLNALMMGDQSRLAGYIQQTFTNPALQETLAYEQAHYAAQNYDPRAIEILQRFAAAYPDSPHKASAMMDAVEVALASSPPRLDIARSQIDNLEKEQLTEEEKERLACLYILIPESQQIWPDAIAACKQALKDYPKSKYAPDILLKQGELLFKNENFNEALVVLQSFPEHYPDSPLREEALFLAGKAAQLCDTEATLQKALAIFEQIAASQSDLSQSAVIEIASILQERMGKSKEAIELLQSLLKQPLPRQTRLMALSIQAAAWASLNDDEEGNVMKMAMDLCTQILETPNIMPSWRFKALSQRGDYAARAGLTDKALDDYYAILSYFDNDRSMNRRDWYWYNLAGFSALHLLQARQDWENALNLARQIAKSNGPGAKKAANEARKIQFEHFIWNDSGEEQFNELEQQFFSNPAPEDRPSGDAEHSE